MLSTVRESRPLSPRSKKGKEKVKEVRYWQDQAGEEVLSALSSKEKKKQEVIFELIQTEESYLKDLEVLYSHFYIPIEKGLIPVAEKETFLSTTFGNLQELISLHKEIVSNLKDIQKKAPVLKRFGTLFLQIVGYLNVYISYNANYPRAKLMLEKELDQNDAFYSHYENQMKNPMCRKLPLESFLSIGTTRLPRYKLYLETMLSKTETTDSDWEQLETAILKLSLVLEKIDRETGKTTNKLTLDELSQSLLPKKGQKENIVEELRLEKEEREFLFEGKVDRLADIESEEVELKMILLDNFLILAEEKEVKEKKDNRERREKKRTLKLFCDPIPIELMAAMEEDEMDKKISELNTFNISFSSDDTMPPINPPVMRTGSRVSISGPSMVPRIHRGSISFKTKIELPQERDKSVTMAIHSMLNNKYHRLAFPNSQEKGLWRRAIDGAIFKVRETWEINFFGRPLGVSWNPEAGVINSAMKFDDPVSKEECLFVAATTGVYRAKILPNGKFGKYELIFKVDDALKVRARKGVNCLFVLAGEAKRLYAIPFANLHSNKKINLNKSEFKVSHTKGTSHFQIGHKKNRIFVCCVRTKETLASSAKLVQVLELEPYKNFKKTIGYFSKIIKEFPLNDEPRSVRLNVFPNAVCILGNSSLQLVDFTTGISREIKPRFQLFEGRFPKSPKRVFRLENDILLCFSELALFLKPNCEPSRPHAIIWKGNPTSFALHGNKILAFSPLFVEVYDLESGQMTQMIHFSNAFHLSENDDSNPEEAILISSVRDGQLFLQQVEYVPAEQ